MAAAGAPAPAAASGPPVGTIEIKSPMVGTFYRSSNPESPSYVEEGDQVTAETAVCIVEAMKVFNEIKAEVEGTIVSILVENGQTVEYGQPMFLVKPA
jgi:acetyl-CoA carboxylase biotin carboxyl carrier protein